MILPVLGVLIILSVPLAGGRLTRVAELQLRRLWLLFGALAVQIVITLPDVASSVPSWLLQPVHLGTYAMAVAFLVVNRRVPGLWLIGTGGLANLVAIAANGGVMPASPWAQRVAGIAVEAGEFSNSAAVEGARLRFLGDVFPIPEALPLSNVFSVGDVALLVGMAVMLHRICGSRLSGSRSVLDAMRFRDPWVLVCAATVDEGRALRDQLRGLGREAVRARDVEEVLQAAAALPEPDAIVVGATLPSDARAALAFHLEQHRGWRSVPLLDPAYVAAASTADDLRRGVVVERDGAPPVVRPEPAAPVAPSPSPSPRVRSSTVVPLRAARAPRHAARPLAATARAPRVRTPAA